MTLDTLLLRADIGGSAYTRDLYFRDCRYASGVLFVPDRAQGAMIGRLFGAQLRTVVADLRITVAAPEPVKSVKAASVIKTKALAAWEARRDLLD